MDAKSLKGIAGELGIQIIHVRDDGWMACHCPFAPYLHKHGKDNRPSFFMRASTDRKSGYNCYSCGMSGPIVALITALGEYRKGEKGHPSRKYRELAIEAEIAEVRSGVRFDYDESDEVEPDPLNENAYGNVFPVAWSCKRARRYLRERGIGRETSDVLGLMFDPEESRIVFPVRDRSNKLYGFTGRTILKQDEWPSEYYGKVKDYFGLRKDRMLLGANLVDLSKPIILVEGLFALAAMMEERVDSVAGVVASMGAHLSKHQALTLIGWGKPVYVFYDNDPAGRLGVYGGTRKGGRRIVGVVDRLGRELPTYVPEWPKGIDDPDDLTFATVRKMMRRSDVFPVDKKSVR